MRIVLDTNILVRANSRAAGPARELLLLIVGSPGHTLLLSPFLLNELERVVSYDRVRRVTRLNEDEVGEYLGYLRAKEVCEMVFPGPAPQVVASDPDDDPIVHTAVTGRADILCTLNRDFTTRTSLNIAAPEGCSFPVIPICSISSAARKTRTQKAGSADCDSGIICIRTIRGIR
jgi:putative PIN family toxin of toxin-antitoxin system